ncbi:MAG: hypothetical protein QME52_11300 [Bacteroidota bacterium]|nr:hypothetical protein [Bacteroidota bacterium]
MIRVAYILLIIVTLLSGCVYFSSNQYDIITSRSSTEWDYRDALTVIAASMTHNFIDNRTNIKVIATPYYPSVNLAIQRNAQLVNHWTEEEFRFNTDMLLRDNVGMYIDWETNRFVDSRGNYFRDKLQIDSLMFLITIQNKAWPCNSMVMANVRGVVQMMVPLISFEQCYIPDISNLEERIFPVNEKNKFIKPKYVWGKIKNHLTMSERIFAMFHFSKRDGNSQEGNYHFLHGSEKMYLIIKGFEMDIKLTFPLSMMR